MTFILYNLTRVILHVKRFQKTIMPYQQIDSLKQIETYVINLVKRPERRLDAIRQFAFRSEFKLTIVDAIEDSFGAMGLWKTLFSIIHSVSERKPDYILVCEDDHRFTRSYSEKKLRECIDKARQRGSDILLGGVSWSGDSIHIDHELFWAKSFSGLQFTIIFSKFFEKFLNANLNGYDAADYHICSLTSDVFLIHPFISIQRSYAYSDVTPLNNAPGRVKQLFLSAESKLKQQRRVSNYFENSKRQSIAIETVKIVMSPDLIIPTYVINLKKRSARKVHISEQFRARSEFNLRFCNGVEHEKGQLGLWESIKKVIRIAKRKDEDVILICEDDHQFTGDYDKDFLIENIIKAHSLGADVLLGGICHFSSSVKAAENLFWIDEFYCTQFMVVFGRFFDQILKEDYDEHMSVDGKISSISANKMVLYPFVSIQRDFGYSDITPRISSELLSATPFYETMSRFELLNNKHRLYK